MATIKEDYVSFETAKLLKEKGFDIPCDYAYNNKAGYFEVDRSNFDEVYCFRPSLAMAMKWLRDIHGWFIHIDVIREASCWLADIQDIKNDVAIYPIEDEFPNYEEACKAAIKYCLENLI